MRWLLVITLMLAGSLLLLYSSVVFWNYSEISSQSLSAKQWLYLLLMVFTAIVSIIYALQLMRIKSKQAKSRNSDILDDHQIPTK
jgi:4-hydroxybenzoate polyprenyltransferase